MYLVISLLVLRAGCGIWLYQFLNIAYLFTLLSAWRSEPQHNKTNKQACVPSEDSDQPGHPPSLIRVFAVHMKKPWVLSYPFNTQRRLWSDWVDAQADLSLRWTHTHFVGFVMSWLKYFVPWLPMEHPAKTLIFAGHTNGSVGFVVYQLNNNKNQQNGKCAQRRLRSAHCFVMMQHIWAVSWDYLWGAAQKRRLAWAFAGRLCDKHHNLISWCFLSSGKKRKSVSSTADLQSVLNFLGDTDTQWQGGLTRYRKIP